MVIYGISNGSSSDETVKNFTCTSNTTPNQALRSIIFSKEFHMYFNKS